MQLHTCTNIICENNVLHLKELLTNVLLSFLMLSVNLKEKCVFVSLIFFSVIRREERDVYFCLKVGINKMLVLFFCLEMLKSK